MITGLIVGAIAGLFAGAVVGVLIMALLAARQCEEKELDGPEETNEVVEN